MEHEIDSFAFGIKILSFRDLSFCLLPSVNDLWKYLSLPLLTIEADMEMLHLPKACTTNKRRKHRPILYIESNSLPLWWVQHKIYKNQAD